MTQLRTLALATSLALASPWLFAQTATTLTPPKDRISDSAIQADHQSYEALQARIKGLNDRGRPLRDYHLSKAQCWLDVSLHEYTRNDRSAFPQAALTESEKLVQGMERGAGALPMDTLLVNDAARLRPDLWERAAALKGHAGFRCAQQKLACAEVELVHAGNEHNQQQWRHARPYVQIAEDLLGEARELAEACAVPVPTAVAAVVAPAAAVPVAPAVAPAPVPAAPRPELQLATMVLFSFDRHDSAGMKPFSAVQLQELVARVQREGLVVRAVQLSGHADRLKHGVQPDYNQQLSEKRVATVKAALVKLGIDGARIQTAARGDAVQVLRCEQHFKRPADLQECLLPNRRVEVLIETRRP
ncbi:MAG: OmpA family protein [Rubrivivax sp.]|nr:OmpA family protein [Rubrivivax sp.]